MSGLNCRHQTRDALAVADIGDPAFDVGAGTARGEHLGDRIKGRLRILDDQETRRAERNHALADLRADRAATAGDDDALALDQGFQTRVVDRLARPQQQVLDRNRGEPRHIPLLERRQAADDQAKPPRPHQHGFGMRIRLEGGRRHHHPGDRFVALGEAGDDVLDVVDRAHDRHVADELAEIGAGRRQHPDRPQMLDGAALDAAEHDLGIGGAPDQERRRGIFGPDVMHHAGVAEIAIGQPQRAQRGDFQEPVEDDGDLAEKEGAVHVRRDEDVVEREKGDGEHRGDADDVQRIGQRDEAPLRRRQVEDVEDDHAEGEEIGQDLQQQRQAGREVLATLEAQIERHEQGRGRRHHVVKRDQEVTQGKMRKTRHLPAEYIQFCIQPDRADSASRRDLPALRSSAAGFSRAPAVPARIEHHAAGYTDAEHVHPPFMEVEKMGIEQRGEYVLDDDQQVRSSWRDRRRGTGGDAPPTSHTG